MTSRESDVIRIVMKRRDPRQRPFDDIMTLPSDGNHGDVVGEDVHVAKQYLLGRLITHCDVVDSDDTVGHQLINTAFR